MTISKNEMEWLIRKELYGSAAVPQENVGAALRGVKKEQESQSQRMERFERAQAALLAEMREEMAQQRKMLMRLMELADRSEPLRAEVAEMRERLGMALGLGEEQPKAAEDLEHGEAAAGNRLRKRLAGREAAKGKGSPSGSEANKMSEEAERRKREAAEKARKAGADRDLRWGVARRDLEDVRAALKAGANPNGTMENGEPMLCSAAATIEDERSEKILGELLEAGADPRVAGAHGQTALHRLARSGGGEAEAAAIRAGEKLVRSGADVMAKDSGGWGPLEVALRWDRMGMARELIGWGAKPTDQDALGRKISEVLKATGGSPEAKGVARSLEESGELEGRVKKAETAKYKKMGRGL